MRTRAIGLFAVLASWGCGEPMGIEDAGHDAELPSDAGFDAAVPDAGPPPCDPWGPDPGCSEGERCLPGEVVADEGTCVPTGSAGEDEACASHADCAEDLVCAPVGVCRRACKTDTAGPAPGGTCLAPLLCVSLDPAVSPAASPGWCIPHCTPFQDRCGAGSWCQPIDAYYEGGGTSLDDYRLAGVCTLEGDRRVGEPCTLEGPPAPETSCAADLRCADGRCLSLCRPSGIGAPRTSCRPGELCLDPRVRFRDLAVCVAPCDVAAPSCGEGFACEASDTVADNDQDYCYPSR